MMNTILVFTFLMFSSLCYCKSIQNQNISSNETHDDRIANLEKVVKNLENRINILNETDSKSLVRGEPVMFYAIIPSRAFILNAESTIVFEQIIVNIGDHYNKYDGVIVAPRKGVYLFSWSISIYSGQYAVTELVDVISSTGDSAANSGYRSTSMTALCRMKKGDHAFIRTTGAGSSHHMHSADNYPRTSFLGMILRDE